MNTLLERFQERRGENRGIKEFIDVLLLTRNYGQKQVEDAVERALENGLGNAAGIRCLLETAGRQEDFPDFAGFFVGGIANTGFLKFAGHYISPLSVWERGFFVV